MNRKCGTPPIPLDDIARMVRPEADHRDSRGIDAVVIAERFCRPACGDGAYSRTTVDLRSAALPALDRARGHPSEDRITAYPLSQRHVVERHVGDAWRQNEGVADLDDSIELTAWHPPSGEPRPHSHRQRRAFTVVQVSCRCGPRDEQGLLQASREGEVDWMDQDADLTQTTDDTRWDARPGSPRFRIPYGDDGHPRRRPRRALRPIHRVAGRARRLGTKRDRYPFIGAL